MILEGDEREVRGYAVLLVERGEIEVDGQRLGSGATAVLPAGAGSVVARGTGVLLLCRPPR